MKPRPVAPDTAQRPMFDPHTLRALEPAPPAKPAAPADPRQLDAEL